MRSSSTRSPCASAGSSAASTSISRWAIAACVASSASSAAVARSIASWATGPSWLVASASSASTVASARSTDRLTRAAIASSCSGVRVGLESVTSIAVRIAVSGVRSSCAALATNCFWLVKAASSRSSITSNVSASCLSSSSGPVSARRWPSRSSDARRAASVIDRTGRSARPATSQPRPAAAIARTPRAISDAPFSAFSVPSRRS